MDTEIISKNDDENDLVHKTDSATDKFRNRSVDSLHLRTRIRHILAKNKIITIGELINRWDELPDLYGLGECSIIEISKALDTYQQNIPEISSQVIPEETKVSIEASYLLEKPSWVKQFPEELSLDDIPIEKLELSERVYNSLRREGIYTLMNLAALNCEIRDMQFRNFGPGAKKELSDKLDLCIAKAIQDPSECMFLIIDQDEINDPVTPVQFLEELLTTIDQEQAVIIQEFYGLRSGTRKTLKEICKVYKKSSTQVKREIFKSFMNFSRNSQYSLGNSLEQFIKETIHRHGGIISNRRLIDKLDSELFSSGFSAKGVLEMLRDPYLARFCPKIYYIEGLSAWMIQDADYEIIKLSYKAYLETLKNNPKPMLWPDLFASLHQKPELLALNEEFAFAIALVMADVGYLVQRADGSWSIPQAKSAEMVERICMVLNQIGNPAHFNQIGRVYNELFSHDPKDDRTIHAVLTRSTDTFARVGRGTYGLLDWGLHSDGNIANAVWRVLNAHQQPMKFDEIVFEIQQTWQVEIISIQAAINTDSRFTRFEDGRIGITETGTRISKVNKRGDSTRSERLLDVMLRIGSHCHYKDITREHNWLYPGSPLTETRVYNALIQLRPKVVHHSGGIFGIVEWGAPQPNEGITTSGRLVEVFEAVNHPMHYKEIHCVHNQLYPETPLSLGRISQFLTKHTEIFIRTGQGTYGLVGWNLTEQKVDRTTAKARLIQVLSQAGAPMHYKEIHKAHNQAYPDHTVADSTIYHRLHKDPDTFVNTGNGIFGLAKWGLEKGKSDQSTTAVRLREILLKKNKPMHYSEIHAIYNQLFPEMAVSKNTVHGTLSDHSEAFIKTGHGYFCLAEWSLLPKQDKT